MVRGYEILVAGILIVGSCQVFGQEAPSPAPAAPPAPSVANTATPRQQKHARAFMLGVCVGQTLLMQNQPTLVTPTSTFDQTTMATMRTAIQYCRAQIAANAANPPPAQGTPAPISPIPTPVNTPGGN